MSGRQKNVVAWVDDGKVDRVLALKAIERLQVREELRLFESGDDFLDYLGACKSNATLSVPKLVLLDLNMPGQNGLDVLRAVRADSTWRTLAVLILTSSSDQEDAEACYALGANAFITKPARFEGLVTLLKDTLSFWFEAAELPSLKVGQSLS